MQALIFDPFSGISGDMTVAALLDIGLPLDWLQAFAAGLNLGPVEVGAKRVQRLGITCTQLTLRLPHEHAHRHLSDVRGIIHGTQLSGWVKEKADDAFTRLAIAEAEVHGTTPDGVHFHEVGALDAIFDVLGAMAGCAELGFGDFYTRPVTLGRGWVDMAHGHFPVPPPAVVKLLQGMEVRDPNLEGECTTPTGAAVLQALTGGRAAPASYVPVSSGYGAGARDPKDRPNCLRLIAAQVNGGAGEEELLMIQSDIDDLVPEFVPPLITAMIEAGALDCTATPLLMKKGRPGLRVEALLPPPAKAAVAGALFAASSSLGFRAWSVQRTSLERREETVEWRGQRIRVKRSSLPGHGERAKPEFEDVLAAAGALGIEPLAAYRAMLADGVAAES